MVLVWIGLLTASWLAAAAILFGVAYGLACLGIYIP